MDEREEWEKHDDWFNLWFETLWIAYDWKKGGMSSAMQKGVKKKARISARARVRNKKKARRILVAVREQLRLRMRIEKEGKFVPAMPHLVTWINQERWELELDDDTGLNEVNKPKGCRTCGKPVHGPMFAHCTEHLPEAMPVIRRFTVNSK